jgi:hypothetical protein
MESTTAGVVDRVLREPGTWAVVGLSTNRARAAYDVAAYLETLGHITVPVHPDAPTVNGRRGYRRLRDLPQVPDVVDVFVNSDRAGAVVDEAVEIGAPVVWLQLGVHADEAVARARAAGVVVVEDTCPAIEGRARGME